MAGGEPGVGGGVGALVVGASVGAPVGVVGAAVVGLFVGIGVGALVKHIPCVDVGHFQVAGLCRVPMTSSARGEQLYIL